MVVKQQPQIQQIKQQKQNEKKKLVVEQEVLNSKGEKIIIGKNDLRTRSLGLFSVIEDQILLNVIFNEFTCIELLRLQMVSPGFYIMLGDDRLWKDAFFRDIKGRPELVKYKENWKITAISFLFPNAIEKFEKPYKPIYFPDFYSHEIYTRWLRRHMKVKDYGIDLGHIKHIETDELTVEEFIRDYEKPCIPVIFKNAQKGTRMMENGEWSEERLLERCGDVIFKISHQNNKRIQMTFRDYCDYMKHQTDEEPLYVFDQAFGEKSPTLLDDYQVPKFFPEDLFKYNGERRPHFRWIVIGPERSGASWHIDPAGTSAWNSLISGRKRWLMYPPSFTPYTVNLDDIQEKIYGSPPSLLWLLEVYPYLPPDYRPVECIQEPGETIFVPGGWWHMVLNMEQSIAVTQNFCDSQNFEQVCTDLADDDKKDYIHFKKHLLDARPDFQDKFNQFEFKHDQFKHPFEDTTYWDPMIKLILNNHKFEFKEKPITTPIPTPTPTPTPSVETKPTKDDNQEHDEKDEEEDDHKERNYQPIEYPESTLEMETPTSGQSPVFIVDKKYVIKFYCSEFGGEKSWATELYLYSKFQENQILNSTFPKLLAYGNIKDLKGSDKLLNGVEWKWPYIVTSYLKDTLNLQQVQYVPDSLPYPYPPLPEEDDEDEDNEEEDDETIVSDDKLINFLVENITLIHSIEINDNDNNKTSSTTTTTPIIKTLINEFKNDKWKSWKDQLSILESKYISNHWNWNGLPVHLRLELNNYLPNDKSEIIDYSMDPCFIHADLTDENVLGIENEIETTISVLKKSKKTTTTTTTPTPISKNNNSSLSSKLKKLSLKKQQQQEEEYVEIKKIIKVWEASNLIDLGDSRIADRWYELVSLYISVFALDKLKLKSFLSKYKLPQQSSHKGKSWLDYYNENPQSFIKRAMQYTLIHHCDAITTASRHQPLIRTVKTIDELANLMWNLDYNHVEENNNNNNNTI